MTLSRFIPLLLVPFVLASQGPDQVVIADDPPNPCTAQLPAGLVAGKTVSQTVHGSGRSYLIHLPEGYDNTVAHPLILSFHGAKRDAAEQEGLSGFSDPRFKYDGIAVYPQADGLYWFTHPNATVTHASPNDLDYVGDLLDQVTSTLCVDTDAIYAAGKSNGGGLTGAIACDSTLGPRFAAFASVSGAYYQYQKFPNIKPCSSGTQYTPFIEFHSVQDCIARYKGKLLDWNNASTQISVESFLEQLLILNDIEVGEPDVLDSDAIDFVNIMKWNSKKHTGIVQHYQESSLGHVWPTTTSGNDDCTSIPGLWKPQVGVLEDSDLCPHVNSCPLPDRHAAADETFYSFDATAVILDFFARHKLPTRHKL